MTNKIRINKYLALCGLGSRRKVEELVNQKKIRINGRIADSLNTAIDPDNDVVEFNNKILICDNEKHYLILNKPAGYVTSRNDELGRAVVMDLVPERYRTAMVNPVGRLDRDSEGLLLLTNDGDLAFRLTHPKYKVTKEYIAEIDRPLNEKDKAGMEKGVFLYGRKTNPPKLYVQDSGSRIIRIIIDEGKKRHIRLMFKKFSYNVRKLKRISFGPVKLGGIKPGSFRVLKKAEVKNLLKAVSS